MGKVCGDFGDTLAIIWNFTHIEIEEMERLVQEIRTNKCSEWLNKAKEFFNVFFNIPRYRLLRKIIPVSALLKSQREMNMQNTML